MVNVETVATASDDGLSSLVYSSEIASLIIMFVYVRFLIVSYYFARLCSISPSSASTASTVCKISNLGMNEEETIFNYYAHLCEISNKALCLGKRLSGSKLMQKMLRSLPKRFAIKVTTIEEAKEITTIKLDELVGST